jgi:hypothetical protein
MLARLFVSFCMIFSTRSPKDGLSNFGSVLCGLGGIGVFLFSKGLISDETACWFALAPLIGGGSIGWATSKNDNLGL